MRNDCSNCGTEYDSKRGCFPIDGLGSCTLPDFHKWAPKKPEYTSCDDCEDFLIPLGSKPCKGCAANNHENFRPKKEDNVEKTCETCDKCEHRSWNYTRCSVTICNLDDSKWKLRRDYNQENKEQEMYKPTSSCTLKNIAAKIHETGCSEAKAEFFHVYCEHTKEYELQDTRKPIVHDGQLIKILTKTEKRRNWLLQHSFIEEEISLKPCPFCGSECIYLIEADEYYVSCENCEITGPQETEKHHAIKAWNTRKQ